MSKDEIIKLIQSLNSSLDIQFLEGLSKVELSTYATHLKAVRLKTLNDRRRAAAESELGLR
jgi:hypothetical protein